MRSWMDPVVTLRCTYVAVGLLHQGNLFITKGFCSKEIIVEMSK